VHECSLLFFKSYIILFLWFILQFKKITPPFPLFRSDGLPSNKEMNTGIFGMCSSLFTVTNWHANFIFIKSTNEIMNA
jgi:hypothetical protein